MQQFETKCTRLQRGRPCRHRCQPRKVADRCRANCGHSVLQSAFREAVIREISDWILGYHVLRAAPAVEDCRQWRGPFNQTRNSAQRWLRDGPHIAESPHRASGNPVAVNVLCQIPLQPVYLSRSNLPPTSCPHHPRMLAQSDTNSQ
jgi:hypothetical protein